MPEKLGNGGNSLENYDPETGRYVADENGSGLKKDKKTKTRYNKKDLLDDLDIFADEEEEDLSSWTERRNFWLSSEKRDPVWVCDNIEKFFDKEVVDFIKKYDFHTSAPLGTNGTYNYKNWTLTNAIAFQMYEPMTPLSPEEFDELKEKVRQSGYLYSYNAYDAPLTYLERGFGNKEVIEKSYLSTQPNDCVLTDGAYGSCVYTAFDANTAKSYSHGRYIMKYIIDNTKGHKIDRFEMNELKTKFQNRMPQVQARIEAHCKNIGLEDWQAQKIAKIFKTTVDSDETFPAVICGYDVYYAGSYGLLLRFRNVVTRKDW